MFAQFKNFLSAKPEGVTQSYLVECESLRGFAILLVVLFHGFLELKYPHDSNPSILSSYIREGQTGVTLFFVLSGFLLSLGLLNQTKFNASRFYINRILRIVPLYSLWVITAGIFFQKLYDTLTALLFWDLSIYKLYPFGTTWWSLMVEVQFYLLLPWLILLFKSPQWRWSLWPLLILASLFYLDITGHWDWLADKWFVVPDPKSSLFGRWPAFLCGALLAWIHQRYGHKLREKFQAQAWLAKGGGDTILFGLILLLGLELKWIASMDQMSAFLYYFDHFAIEAFLWTLLVATILYLPLFTARLWVNPLWNFFGLISYSLYLCHGVVIFFGFRHIPTLLTSTLSITLSHEQLIALCILIAIVFSVVSYHFIEKPALRLKTKLIKQSAGPLDSNESLGKDSSYESR